MTEQLFTATKTALVLIDMQGAVTSHPAEPHPAEQVIERAAALVGAARRAGALPVYVRTSFLADESDSPAQPIDQQRGAKYRADGWDRLVEAMQPLPTEPVVVKRSWNAFHGSDLDLQLRRHGIETVVMAGISTNFGVEGTARAAYDHGYHLVFVEDAMATNTAENHEFAVRNIFPGIGRVRDLATVLAAFDAQATAGSESADLAGAAR